MASIPRKHPLNSKHATADLKLPPGELDGFLQLSYKHSKLAGSDCRSDPVVETVEDLAYYPKNFRLFARMPFGQALWEFLKRSDNLLRMQTATYLKRPAVEPLSEGLLAEFGYELGENGIKQMIGHMVGQIMKATGYELDARGLRITTPGLFSVGARYRPVHRRDGEKATKLTPK